MAYGWDYSMEWLALHSSCFESYDRFVFFGRLSLDCVKASSPYACSLTLMEVWRCSYDTESLPRGGMLIEEAIFTTNLRLIRQEAMAVAQWLGHEKMIRRENRSRTGEEKNKSKVIRLARIKGSLLRRLQLRMTELRKTWDTEMNEWRLDQPPLIPTYLPS